MGTGGKGRGLGVPPPHRRAPHRRGTCPLPRRAEGLPVTRASILDWPTAELPATAEEWFARVHAPDCTASDEAAFEKWLHSDPRNAIANSSCEKGMALSEVL